MISKSLFSIVLLTCLTGFSQDKKQQDIKSIKSMCGCYEVKFNFTETFKYPKDSLTNLQKPNMTVFEWVELLEDKPNKIVMQHLLIVSDENDIIKHWRQDWLYENTDLYSFDKDQTWKYKKLQIKTLKGNGLKKYIR